MNRKRLAVVIGLVAAVLFAGCEAAPSIPAARPSPARVLPCVLPTPPAGPGSACTPAPQERWTPALVVGITDGDTIRVLIGSEIRKVRYIGMDTPERNQAGYEAAKQANAALVMNRTVYLERDCSEDDGERLLRYVWLDDGRMVNEELVRMGVALPVQYRPDTRHHVRLEAAAREAWAARRGFWAGGADAFPYAMVTVNALPMYQGPDASQPIRDTLMCGDALAIYGRTPDGAWLQVRGPGHTGGWVRADGVEQAKP